MTSLCQAWYLILNVKELLCLRFPFCFSTLLNINMHYEYLKLWVKLVYKARGYLYTPIWIPLVFFRKKFTVPLISGLYRFGISHVKAQISGHHGFALGRDSAFAFSRSWSSLLPYVIKSLRKWRATWLSSGFLPCAKHFFNTLAHFFASYTQGQGHI